MSNAPAYLDAGALSSRPNVSQKGPFLRHDNVDYPQIPLLDGPGVGCTIVRVGRNPSALPGRARRPPARIDFTVLSGTLLVRLLRATLGWYADQKASATKHQRDPIMVRPGVSGKEPA